MKTINILGLKGGIAKTTTALNLTRALRQSGSKVLLIDLDYQKNLTTLLEEDTNKKTILQVLDGSKEIVDVISNDFIASDEDLLALENISPTQLKTALKEVASKYDYCIIDNHCILNAITLNSLLACDLLIIPTQATRLGYINVEDMISLTDLIKRSYKKIINAKVLLTNYTAKLDLNSQYKDLIAEKLKESNIKLLETIIRHSQPIEDSQALNLDLFTSSKRSNGAKDYLALAEEIKTL